MDQVEGINGDLYVSEAEVEPGPVVVQGLPGPGEVGSPSGVGARYIDETGLCLICGDRH